MQTDYAGNPELTCQSQPFGDAQLCTVVASGADDTTEQHFTGKERDSESGLDYFGARYLGSSMGRWTNPDPSSLYYADPRDPQSLNLYAYVGNHPLTYIDPHGLSWFNQAPCSGTYYAGMSIAGELNNFFAHLFASCGGGGSSGDQSPGATPGVEPNFNLSPGVSPLRFTGRDAAGIAAALQALGPTSQKDWTGECSAGCEYEWGGRILKDKNGKYTFTNPVTFKDGGEFWPTHVMIPFGYHNAGLSHSYSDWRNVGQRCAKLG